LRIHLGNAGYEVRLAEDAITAGHLILRDPPDLVLLDIDMPHMSGLELLEAMRADPMLPKVPVVLLTAHTDAQGRAKELGVGFLSKPIFLDQLLREVAHYLPGEGRMPIG
jgi:CheY-like chemotaxis protein